MPDGRLVVGCRGRPSLDLSSFVAAWTELDWTWVGSVAVTGRIYHKVRSSQVLVSGAHAKAVRFP